jgi:hypothetical protein
LFEDAAPATRGDSPSYVMAFFAERYGHELAMAFVRIRDPGVQLRIVRLVEQIAADYSGR